MLLVDRESDHDSELEETLTASECGSECEIPMDISELENVSIEVQHGPESKQDRDNRLNRELKEKIDMLNRVGGESELLPQHVKLNRVVVDVSTTLPLFERKCPNEECSEKSKVVNHKLVGGVLQVSWNCPNNHSGYWVSSQVLCQKNGQDIYSTSLLFALGLLLSGNHYDKIMLFCKFLGLNFISRQTFHRMQKHYIIPCISSFWEDMKSEVWKVLANEQLILCGDGRNDSPGHCAKYCVYLLMEQFLDIIVDIQVTDKRQTGGVSTNMEVYTLKKLLERIVGKLLLSEIVTDASATIMKLVRDMKGKLGEILLITFGCFVVCMYQTSVGNVMYI